MVVVQSHPFLEVMLLNGKFWLDKSVRSCENDVHPSVPMCAVIIYDKKPCGGESTGTMQNLAGDVTLAPSRRNA